MVRYEGYIVPALMQCVLKSTVVVTECMHEMLYIHLAQVSEICCVISWLEVWSH